MEEFELALKYFYVYPLEGRVSPRIINKDCRVVTSAYQYARFRHDGKVYCVPVHRLVYHVANPGWNSSNMIHHKDFIKLNNELINLQSLTGSEHSSLHGKVKPSRATVLYKALKATVAPKPKLVKRRKYKLIKLSEAIRRVMPDCVLERIDNTYIP